MSGTGKTAVKETSGGYVVEDLLSPFKREAWQRLTPAERLDRSWRLRKLIPDRKAVHDRKLFPKP